MQNSVIFFTIYIKYTNLTDYLSLKCVLYLSGTFSGCNMMSHYLAIWKFQNIDKKNSKKERKNTRRLSSGSSTSSLFIEVSTSDQFQDSLEDKTKKERESSPRDPYNSNWRRAIFTYVSITEKSIHKNAFVCACLRKYKFLNNEKKSIDLARVVLKYKKKIVALKGNFYLSLKNNSKGILKL